MRGAENGRSCKAMARGKGKWEGAPSERGKINFCTEIAAKRLCSWPLPGFLCLSPAFSACDCFALLIWQPRTSIQRIHEGHGLLLVRALCETCRSLDTRLPRTFPLSAQFLRAGTVELPWNQSHEHQYLQNPISWLRYWNLLYYFSEMAKSIVCMYLYFREKNQYFLLYMHVEFSCHFHADMPLAAAASTLRIRTLRQI